MGKIQEKVKAEPFPKLILPMLATLSSKMPEHQEHYGFEFKWDGYRILCHFDGKKMWLNSRNGNDFTNRYPELHGLKKVFKKPIVVDGEVVALNSKGFPDFQLLQERSGQNDIRAIQERMKKIPIVYVIFDVLYYENRTLINEIYTSRRQMLERIGLSDRFWKLSEMNLGDGDTMLQVSREHHFEGIVAKQLDSIYEIGRRSPNWLKIRLFKRQEFVIGGWTIGEGYSGIGSLLVGFYEKQKGFRYAGHVGTGFSNAKRQEIEHVLKKIEISQSPFYNKVDRRDSRFVKPLLVCEVQFTEWTSDLRLRHPSFIAFRVDKNPEDVVLEKSP